MSTHKKKITVAQKPASALAASQQSADGAVQGVAKLMISPEMACFRVITQRERSEVMANLDVEVLLGLLREQTHEVQHGDMKLAEAMLINQAVALQSLFVKWTEKGMETGLLRQQETAFRLALKAQSQCRATLETLFNIKHPPIVYAKQANVTTGPQQINNGVPPPMGGDHAGAPQKKSRKNKLKEIAHEPEQEQWLDAGAPRTAGRKNQAAKAMAPLHGTQKRGR